MSTKIRVHAAQVLVRNEGARVYPTALHHALSAPANSPASDYLTYPLGEVSAQAPTSADMGWVRCGELELRLAPGQNASFERLLAQLDLAGQGKLGDGDEDKVPGLNFVAFDVETANADVGSICQIGAVRFRDGLPVDSFSTLCQPPPQVPLFDAANSAIHGLHAEDVADAVPCVQALRSFLDFLGEDPFLAHNASFDAMALQRAANFCEVELGHRPFGCSLTMARRAKLPTTSHALPAVTKALGLPEFSHHDATADALAAGRIVAALASPGTLAEVQASFGDFAMGEVSNARLKYVLQEHKPAPAPKRKAPWQSDPAVIPEPNLEADPNNPLFGQNVTFTGDFPPYGKEVLWEAVAQQGAQIAKNVTKKTTMVILGEWKSTTSKEKRARELISQGQEIKLLSASQLLALIDLPKEP